MHKPVSGVIIAGGKSVRLGQDKRRLRLWGDDGPMLLEHTLTLLQPICDDLVVVLNDAADWPDLAAQVVPDAYPDGGALGGIATGLEAAQHRFALVVAADMPLLNPVVLRWMVAQPRTYDILAPRTATDTKSGGWETLCAIYSRVCLPLMQAQLHDGNLKIRWAYDQVHVQPIERDQLNRLDPSGTMFHNINTPADLVILKNTEQKTQNSET